MVLYIAWYRRAIMDLASRYWHNEISNSDGFGLYQVRKQAGFGAFLENKKAPNLSPDLTMRYLLEYLVGSWVKLLID